MKTKTKPTHDKHGFRTFYLDRLPEEPKTHVVISRHNDTGKELVSKEMSEPRAEHLAHVGNTSFKRAFHTTKKVK